jgi:oligoribonuclease NrnB/cAMP/cGMP phosphodiesterase (DHH superfamily)
MAAAWCMWTHFGDNAEYLVGQYQGALPDVVDRDVYLVDFSYPLETMEQIIHYADNVYLIDHHKSALEELWILGDVMNVAHSNLAHSGARLAWDFVQSVLGSNLGKKRPALIDHIEDRDLWKFLLDGTEEITTALFSHALTYRTIDKFMRASETTLKKLRAEGVTLLRKHKVDVQTIIDTGLQRISFLEFSDIPLVNCNHMFASDVGNLLSLTAPFAITYTDTAKHRVFSLRSNSQNRQAVDVSRIAKIFGGGGHARAAGFKVSRSDDLARI